MLCLIGRPNIVCTEDIRAFECDSLSVWTQLCKFLYIHKTSLQMLDSEQDTNYTSNYMVQLRVHRARKESIPCTEWANK